MFKEFSEARSVIADIFPADLAELLVAALLPVIAFVPGEDITKQTLTRIGGTPVMAASVQWPRPDRAADGVDFSVYGDEIVAHVDRAMPLPFIGQVDLAHLPQGADEAGALPREGRLLFFYDFMAGPYANGAAFSRVIWDTSPASNTAARAIPPEIGEADRAFAEQTRTALKAVGLNATEDDLRSPFLAPLRVGTTEIRWQIPPLFALEVQANTALIARFAEDTDAEDAYRDLPYAEKVSEDLPVLRLLGLPDPEQDDPRYDAVVVTEFAKQFLSSDEWVVHKDTVFAKAIEWRLLAQVDFAGWAQSNGEGTVYFLIRHEDLA